MRDSGLDYLDELSEEDPHHLYLLQFIYGIFLYFHVCIVLLILLLSYQFFHPIIFSYFALYLCMCVLSTFSVFGNDKCKTQHWLVFLIMGIFTIGSIAGLGLAVYFSLFNDLSSLSIWNNDYDDVEGTFRVFLILFNFIPVIHEVLYFSVHIHRKRISGIECKQEERYCQEPNKEPLIKKSWKYDVNGSLNVSYSSNIRDECNITSTSHHNLTDEQDSYIPPTLET
ncbi:unnamed protein product [Moneuplotes crassus]|uniref:Transmembrane protein n=1 Tax=Euplotes crassus TaxID=5936 RepID=A0AAD2CZT4_EUPCR|nr:unnamed protein product [Moneuplotes crassus]